MNKTILAGSVSLAVLTSVAIPVWAAETAEPSSTVEALIVTARAGATPLTKSKASYAISVVGDQELRLVNPTSTAEVFKMVPGFWVESSGGEGSNNIRTRGIPRDGYSSVALLEDGLPVQQDPGLGYLNADQSFRMDESIERVEAVRGGPSSIFSSNAPGGAVNFITRAVGDSASGILRAEIGDYEHYRTDFWYGAPIADGWKAYASGFFRSNNGIRNPGFTANHGGQIRLGLSHDWEGGSLDLNFKRIEDSVAFYLPVPILSENNEAKAVPGFDANYGTLAGPETELLSFRNVNGPYDFDLSRGSETKLSQWTAKLKLDVGDGWEMQEGLRYRDSQIQRNGLFPTGNLESASVRAANLLSSAKAAYSGTTSVKLQYVNSANGTFDMTNANGNGLVVSANALAVTVPLKEFINDLRFVKTFKVGGQTHDVAVGGLYSNYEFVYDRYMSTAQLDVRNNARLLDAVAVDTNGKVLGKVTENGFLRYGSLFDNTQSRTNVFAFYASDEWQVSDALRIDGGLRYESSSIEGSVEGKTTVDLGVAGTLADNQVITGTGVFTPIDRHYSHTSWTLGGNYQFTPTFGSFARYTSTFRMPNGSDFTGSPTRTDIIVEPIKMSEAGLKYSNGLVDIFGTAFYTKYEAVRFTDNIFNSSTNSYRTVTGFADTVTYGLELEGKIYPTKWFDFGAAVTLQSPEYKNFIYSDVVNGVAVQRNFDGKQLIRVPKLGVRLVPGVTLLDGALRAQMQVEYYSKRYADVANSQELPSYWVLNASARYNLTERLTVSANGENLTNSIGLTEGNPRAGQFVSGDAGARYILARPIMGRAFRAALTYRF